MTHRNQTSGLCPDCGAPTGCGVEQGLSHCWCFDMPHLTPTDPAPQPSVEAQPADLRCLCPACLQKRQAVSNRASQTD